jgi:hypothetical protein
MAAPNDLLVSVLLRTASPSTGAALPIVPLQRLGDLALGAAHQTPGTRISTRRLSWRPAGLS